MALHLPISSRLVNAMGEAGISTRLVSRPARARGASFRDSLTKLRIFELTEYERVVFADADAMPLRALDHLFELPLSGALAAPVAYWLPQPFWTTALLVVEPSAAVWDRAARHLKTARWHRQYDMDIVNAEFAGEIDTLDPESFCLNSEWEDAGRPGFFPDPVDAYSRVSLVHFTALGKPWSYSLEEARRLRPGARPEFFDLWSRWHGMREEVARQLGV